jgi:hypothetical protein
MFFFSNLPDNKLLFNDTQNTFVVFKIDTTNTDKDLIEVDDFVNLITRNHQLLLSLEAIVENRYTKSMFDSQKNRIRIPFRRSPNIKLNRVSKQSPTSLELAVSGFKLGFDIAELLNELLKRGANSNEFRNLLIRYNIPVELVESLSNELDRMIEKLRPINQFITIFYGVKLI